MVSLPPCPAGMRALRCSDAVLVVVGVDHTTAVGLVYSNLAVMNAVRLFMLHCSFLRRGEGKRREERGGGGVDIFGYFAALALHSAGHSGWRCSCG